MTQPRIRLTAEGSYIPLLFGKSQKFFLDIIEIVSNRQELSKSQRIRSLPSERELQRSKDYLVSNLLRWWAGDHTLYPIYL